MQRFAMNTGGCGQFIHRFRPAPDEISNPQISYNCQGPRQKYMPRYFEEKFLR